MRILWIMRHPMYVRNYELAIRRLAEQGHSIHIGFTNFREIATDELPRSLAKDYETVTVSMVPSRSDRWVPLVVAVRGVRDYVRYLHPRYRDAPRLAGRARARLPERLNGLLELWASRTGPNGIEVLDGVLRLIERAVPPSEGIAAVIRGACPDVVLVTPVVDLDSRQVDYLKSARALGLPVGLPVASWDNLTNKGLIHVQPDLLIVWNEIQRREAIELHRVPPDRIAITGAQLFDEWFERQASPREEFCRRVGLDPERPFLLYLCSSGFISDQQEPQFVERWLGALRGSGRSRLQDTGVLVRPHPANAMEWAVRDLASFENAVIWPRGGRHPIDERSKREYFDSLYHAAAVVGINTSGFIEAAILGRPVHTIAAAEFEATQEGTLHFRYLLPESGGPLRVARSIEQHLDLLDADLKDPEVVSEQYRRWVGEFVRPHGLQRPATPYVVDAILDLPRYRHAPVRLPWWAFALRPPLEAAAFLAALVMRRGKWRSQLRQPARTPVPKPQVAAAGDGAVAEAPVDDGHLEQDVRHLMGAMARVPEPAAARLRQSLERTLPLEYPEHSIKLVVRTKEEFLRLRAVRKEPWTVTWLEKTMGPGEVFYDVGANVGAYSLIASRVSGGQARIVAIEPGFANFDALCRNIALNGAGDHVVPLQLALGARTGLADFFYTRLQPGAAGHALHEAVGSGGAAFESSFRQSVPVYRLDDLIPLLGLPHPTHIKIDVDGAEVEVLEGAEKTLESPRLQSVMIEVDRRFEDEVVRRFARAGLSLTDRIDKRSKTGEIYHFFYALFRRAAETPQRT